VTRELLFEIGVEELPSSYAPPALEQLEREAKAGLVELRLPFGEVTTYGTPRRLALLVRGLADHQSDHAEEITGPAVRVAYDAEGRPTRALLGFCQGKGVDPSAVRTVETPKGPYVVVAVKHAGKPALEVLPGLLASLAARLQFPKTMRWLADPDVRFARPVRWLVALLDDRVVPVRAFGLEAGRTTRGHRFLAPDAIELPHAARYLETLERARVMADHRARAGKIAADVRAAARPGTVVEDEELVQINTFLTEWPHVFSGSYDPRHVHLPNEVIITALREHQRFFAVAQAGGEAPGLRPTFVAVRNGNERGIDVVRKGNEGVLAARLEDAQFYWETDLKKSPAEQIEALRSVVWMEGLGSLFEKSQRLQKLGGWLAARLALAESDTVRRAAQLCKTDLLSEMIGSGKEYANLQGVIGGYYARQAGEPQEVADAIYWHYHPRWAGDDLPKTAGGALLSLADKLDHVAGAFAANKIPSGSEDPYGVRRAGNSVVRVLMERPWHLDLHAAVVESASMFFAAGPDLPHAAITSRLGEFWRGRVEAALDERGVPYDIRDATLEARILMAPADAASAAGQPGWTDPCDCLMRARTLTEFRSDARFEPLAVLFKRVGNILKAATETIPAALDRARLAEPAERELASALDRGRERTDPLWARGAYREILPALLEMEGAIHGFFDHVLVNTGDMATRVNRLRLLTEVRDLFVRGWDLSRVVIATPADARTAPGGGAALPDIVPGPQLPA
jgi:glycyl-tRNA synthetase beta chain